MQCVMMSAWSLLMWEHFREMFARTVKWPAFIMNESICLPPLLSPGNTHTHTQTRKHKQNKGGTGSQRLCIQILLSLVNLLLCLPVANDPVHTGSVCQCKIYFLSAGETDEAPGWQCKLPTDEINWFLCCFVWFFAVLPHTNRKVNSLIRTMPHYLNQYIKIYLCYGMACQFCFISSCGQKTAPITTVKILFCRCRMNFSSKFRHFSECIVNFSSKSTDR